MEVSCFALRMQKSTNRVALQSAKPLRFFSLCLSALWKLRLRLSKRLSVLWVFWWVERFLFFPTNLKPEIPTLFVLIFSLETPNLWKTFPFWFRPKMPLKSLTFNDATWSEETVDGDRGDLRRYILLSCCFSFCCSAARTWAALCRVFHHAASALEPWVTN